MSCAFVVMLVLTGYHAREIGERIHAFQQRWEKFGQVDVTDGIQEAEADLIADRYSRLYLGPASACSGTTQPRLIDGVWKANMLFGSGGEPTGNWISVDPISGGVSMAGGRTYGSFHSFRRAALGSALFGAE